jgi:hypothetical protein
MAEIGSLVKVPSLRSREKRGLLRRIEQVIGVDRSNGCENGISPRQDEHVGERIVSRSNKSIMKSVPDSLRN